MLMQSKVRFGVLGIFAMGLTACASMDGIDHNISAAQTSLTEAKIQQDLMKKTGAVVRMKGAKVAGDEVQLRNVNQLPAWFDQKMNYTSTPQSLADILSDISHRTGVVTAMQPSSQVAAQAGSGLPGMVGSNGISVDWNGNLKGLLDHVASKCGMYWKYEEGRIYFFKTETRSFHVFLPIGKRSVKSAINLAGAGGSSGGDSAGGASGSSGSAGGSSVGSSSSSGAAGTVDVSSSLDIDAYDAVTKSIQAMVSNAESTTSAAASSGPATGGGVVAGGASGGTPDTKNVVANPSLGLITVTATPIVLDRVSTYVRGLNERFAQNVMIGVKIYNLTVKQGVNAGVNLTLAYHDLANKYGVSLSGPPNLPPTSGATPGSIVLDALTGSKFSGSSLVLQALEEVGNVSLLTSGQVIAANGQPSPLQVAREVTYLASSSTTQTANVGATTTLTPATRTVGFTANFLPLILGDNRIMLQYQINLSSLLSLDQVSSGGSMIQTPNVATQSLQQQAYVKDGQSIVLFGFEQANDSSQKSNGLTGYSRNGSTDKLMMVIVLEVSCGKS